MNDGSKPQSPKINIIEQRYSSHDNANGFMSKRSFVIVSSILGLIIVIAIILLVKSQIEVRALKKNLATQESSGNMNPDQKELVSAVGKLIILPGDEEPTIATVTDLEKLKGQAFFSNAKLGDKVLIYAKAQKAILFRPNENKIIELAPLNNSASPSTSPAP